ncbi:MAG: WD40 repeat domain-containing protein [Gemmataceae bacterium]
MQAPSCHYRCTKLKLAAQLSVMSKSPSESDWVGLTQTHSFEAHNSTIRLSVIRPQEICFASSGTFDDQRIRVWNVVTGEESRSFPGQLGMSTSCNDLLAARSVDSVEWGAVGRIGVWSLQTGEVVHMIKSQERGVVYSLSFTPDGSHIAAAGFLGPDGSVSESHNSIKVWELRRGSETMHLALGTGEVTQVAFSPDGARIAASERVKVMVWDAASGKRLLERSAQDCGQIQFAHDGSRLVFSEGAVVRIVEVPSGKELSRLTNDDSVGCFCFDNSFKYCLVGNGRNIGIWNLPTGRLVASVPGHDFPVSAIAFCPKSRRVISGDLGGTIKIWTVTFQ